MKRTEKREHLVTVAAEIFNRLGYHGAGIDHVIAKAGIAKTTLYRHFDSKEDLIVAVLKRIDEQYRIDLRQSLEHKALNHKDRLLATFDFLETWFKSRSFYGCPFISAAAEYSDRRSPVFKEALTHKRLVVAYLEELARDAELADPKAIAEQINLLHEGATAIAHISGDASGARTAKGVAATLLREANKKTKKQKS